LPDARREEEQRRLAAQRILSGQGIPSWEVAAAQERESLQAEVERRVTAHKEALARQRQDRVDQERRELDAQAAERLSLDPDSEAREDTDDADSPGGAGGLIVNLNVNMAQASIDEMPVEKAEDDDATLRARFQREIEAAKVVADAQQGRGRCVISSRPMKGIYKHVLSVLSGTSLWSAGYAGAGR
jgi:hypothetical protein